jgi:hypothetical protein
MKPSVPEPMAGEMTATKSLWSADEMRNAPEMTGDMRCREVAGAPEVRAAPKVRTAAAETTAPTKMADAAKAWGTTAEVASAPEVRSAAAKVRSATAAEMTATAAEMTAATTEMTATTAVRRGDRHRRTAQRKRRNDCQHCPAHIFLTVPGDVAKRAAARSVALKYRNVPFGPSLQIWSV